MDIINEFLSIDTDLEIYNYFKTHCFSLFTQLRSRSEFAKQASNLSHVKHLLREELNKKMKMNAQCFIVDGFPMGIDHFKRANKSKSFKGEAEY